MFAWPTLVRLGVWVNSDYGGELVGGQVYLLAGAFIVAAYVVMVNFIDGWGLGDTDPAITAVGVTTASMFGYWQLLPAPFFPVFGADDNSSYSNRLDISKGTVAPIAITIYNTGILSWKGFRVSVESLSDDLTFSTDRPEVLTVFKNEKIIQWNSNLLAVGEPSFADFSAVANKAGIYRLRVRVATEMRPEGRFHRLTIVVKE